MDHRERCSAGGVIEADSDNFRWQTGIIQQIIHLIHHQIYLYIPNAHSKGLSSDGEDSLEVKNLENASTKTHFPSNHFHET